MEQSPLARHAANAGELKQRMDAEARGVPFLVYRDGDGAQRIVELTDEIQELTVGRRESNDLALPWDTGVSRLHAQLARVARDWTVNDDGLSQNGTFVNEVRIAGRRRLRSGDLMRFGSTVVAFVAPSGSRGGTTAIAGKVQVVVRIPPAQKRVLVALCRPLLTGTIAPPASNHAIADELVISTASVKTHLRSLFAKLDVQPLPQNQKRAELARRAIESGLVSARDLAQA